MSLDACVVYDRTWSSTKRLKSNVVRVSKLGAASYNAVAS